MSETLCRVTSHLFRARGTARGLVTLTAASPWLALAHNPFCTQDVQFADERAKQPGEGEGEGVGVGVGVGEGEG